MCRVGSLGIPGPFPACPIEWSWVCIYPPQGTCTLFSLSLSLRLTEDMGHHLIGAMRLDISDRNEGLRGTKEGSGEDMCSLLK